MRALRRGVAAGFKSYLWATRILMKHIFLFFLLATVAATAQYTTKAALPYYPDKGDAYRNERCVLDLYYPEKAGYATVIWFHGGGLTDGNRFVPQELKEKGIAVVAVGYRLSPKAKVTDIIGDAAAAIAWTMQHISDYGGDPKKIFLSGHSAGGYLDLMVGLDKRRLAPYGLDPDTLAGIIPFSPQVITHFTARKEMGLPETTPFVNELAPLYHIRKDAPPILLITGDRELEMLGRYDENAYMDRMLTVLKHPDHRLIEIGGYGHMMAEPAYPLLLKEIERILKKQTP